MKKGIVALLCGVVGANLVWASPPPPQAEPPGSPGLAAIEQACVQCHSLQPIFAQRKSRAQWRQTVAEMAWRGAPVLPGEGDQIADYLAFTFRPASTAGASPRTLPDAAPLPAGDPRALVEQRCLQCHDASLITLQRRTTPQWRDSISKMIRLGARLSDAEAEAIATYLSRHFGEEQ